VIHLCFTVISVILSKQACPFSATQLLSSLQKTEKHDITMAESAVQPRPLQMGAKGAYIVRLLMVGDSACGKTSLVLRFDQNVFSTKFVTTIGVDYRDKMVKVRTLCTSFRSRWRILSERWDKKRSKCLPELLAVYR